MPTHPAEFYQSLPKVELHRHLEGSLRLNTLLEIARQYDLALPGGEKLRSLVQVVDSDPHTSQNFLSKFEILREFYRSPEIIQRVAREVVADAAADNIRYMELRFTPVALSKAAGFPLGEVMDWVIQGVQEAETASDIKTGLIISVNRHESTGLAEQIIQEAIDRRQAGIVGVDLAGDEANYPAAPFKAIFHEARQEGLKSTIHAGEWGPAENVVQAINFFQADRIGHGVRVMEDPQAVELARESGIPFEVCLTSNYQSGVVDDLARHPLQRMIASGLNTTVNTDDPGISQITLGDEYALACEQIGIDLETLKANIVAAAQSAFLSPGARDVLAVSLEEQLAQAMNQ